MRHIDTIVIGGGQAGLAISHCLLDRDVEHIVLERGRIGERWRSERWDSLRLLTPRWQRRLPGLPADPTGKGGYMSRTELVDFLSEYANSFDAPVLTWVNVTSVERCGDEFLVMTNRGNWTARNVVIATGHCDRARIPPMAAHLAADIAQITPTQYKNPSSLPRGGVLVAGASATGIQLAAELERSGRSVVLAVGRHIRLPRRYRGRDILTWFETLGILNETIADVPDVHASRRQPSLQLIGDDTGQTLDLGTLQSRGVQLAGRLEALEDATATFANDLPTSLAHADAKMNRQLDRIDQYIATRRWEARFPVEERPPPIQAEETPGSLDLRQAGIRSVLWATGFSRSYPWLRVPVLDDDGELIHTEGVTPCPGLFALGLNFMRRRNSSFLDGVGADAAFIADHILERSSRSTQLLQC